MRLFALLMSLALVTSPALAQEPDTVVLSHVFRAGQSDTVLVQLSRRAVYRLTVSVPGLEPIVRGTDRGRAAPFLSAEGNGQFEVYVPRDGEYAVTLPRRPTADVHIRLTTDAAASSARRVVQDEPRWTLGGEVAVARHSSNNVAAGGSGGWQGDICLSVRSGRRLAACLGYTSQERATGQHLDWFFVEPRFVVWRNGSYETGVSLRVGQAGRSGSTPFDVSIIAPGAFLATHLTRTPSGRGLDLRLSGFVGSLGNLAAGVSSDPMYRLALGVNWHP